MEYIITRSIESVNRAKRIYFGKAGKGWTLTRLFRQRVGTASEKLRATKGRFFLSTLETENEERTQMLDTKEPSLISKKPYCTLFINKENRHARRYKKPKPDKGDYADAVAVLFVRI